MSVPPLLNSHKPVLRFLKRALEVEHAQPVVSYYCKIHALDYILANKLHQLDPDVEKYAWALVDETEELKKRDDELGTVLRSRQMSANVVFAFAFKLFALGLEDLQKYTGANKPQLAGKLRAAIDFLEVAKTVGDEGVDFKAVTGGACASHEEYGPFVAEKTKVLKLQLSRLLKDEVPINGEEEELEAVLGGEHTEKAPFIDEASSEPQNEEASPEPRNEKASPEPRNHEASPEPESHEAPVSLPGVPLFDPEVKLPEPPKNAPDDVPIRIIRSNSPAPAKQSKPVTKEMLASIVDTTEQIAQVQKHAKFAVSALNYEDIDTAERELLKGLELLRLMKL